MSNIGRLSALRLPSTLSVGAKREVVIASSALPQAASCHYKIVIAPVNGEQERNGRGKVKCTLTLKLPRACLCALRGRIFNWELSCLPSRRGRHGSEGWGWSAALSGCSVDGHPVLFRLGRHARVPKVVAFFVKLAKFVNLTMDESRAKSGLNLTERS